MKETRTHLYCPSSVRHLIVWVGPDAVALAPALPGQWAIGAYFFNHWIDVVLV